MKAVSATSTWCRIGGDTTTRSPPTLGERIVPDGYGSGCIDTIAARRACAWSCRPDMADLPDLGGTTSLKVGGGISTLPLTLPERGMLVRYHFPRRSLTAGV